MRIAVAILIGIHGLIHLFGFLKAFGWARFDAISQPVSKMHGILWLLAFLLLFASLILLIGRSDYWWIITVAGIIISQILIITYWTDAKFGTIANLLILATAVVAYSTLSFEKQVERETKRMLSQMATTEELIVTREKLADLPPVVQNWLEISGAVGKPMAQSVYLEQDLHMKLQPEQQEWTEAEAKQTFTTDPPAFNWSVSLKMKGVLNVAGRDKFVNGKGEMLIKLFSIFPVVDAKESEKIDQGTLQRYLGEIVWFPSAALSPHITWEEIDDKSARATLAFGGTSGSGIFHFDPDGNFEKFVAMRFKGAEDQEPTEWIVRATKTEMIGDRSYPTSAEVAWKTESEERIWLKLNINRLDHNIDLVPQP